MHDYAAENHGFASDLLKACLRDITSSNTCLFWCPACAKYVGCKKGMCGCGKPVKDYSGET